MQAKTFPEFGKTVEIVSGVGDFAFGQSVVIVPAGKMTNLYFLLNLLVEYTSPSDPGALIFRFYQKNPDGSERELCRRNALAWINVDLHSDPINPLLDLFVAMASAQKLVDGVVVNISVQAGLP